MTPTVLVTGCSGFLGGHVADWVLKTGLRLVACVTKREPDRWGQAARVASIRLPDEQLEELIAETKPDCIVHCAGASRVADSFRSPELDYVANVAATKCLYEAVAKRSPRTRVLFLSSAAVYGQPESLPIDEATPLLPLSPYGEHKQLCEQLSQHYRNSDGMRITNLRVFSAYGPGLTKQVLWDMYQKAKLSKTILLQGDGTETRDFIYVDDVVDVIGRFIVSSELSECFPVMNIASGTSVSIRELASLFLSSLGIDRDIEFSGLSFANTPKRWSVDVSLMRGLSIGTMRPLESGLAQYATWLNSLERDLHASGSMAAAG
jgi:UDP-glucose 4-epimerase